MAFVRGGRHLWCAEYISFDAADQRHSLQGDRHSAWRRQGL